MVFSASNSIKFNVHDSNSTEHKIAMSEVFKIIILRSFRCELIFGRFFVLHSTYIILIWKLELRQSHFLRQSHGTPKGQAERRTSRFLCPPLYAKSLYSRFLKRSGTVFGVTDSHTPPESRIWIPSFSFYFPLLLPLFRNCGRTCTRRGFVCCCAVLKSGRKASVV